MKEIGLFKKLLSRRQQNLFVGTIHDIKVHTLNILSVHFQ